MSAMSTEPPRGAARHRSPSAGNWDWPDPQDVAPPQVRAGRPVRATLPLAARWPVEPLPPVWPPAPAGEQPREPEPLPDLDPLETVLPPAGSGRRTQAQPQPEPILPSAALAGAMADDPAPMRDHSAARRDPSPSRMAYRLNRMWLTPAVRHFVAIGLPVIVLVLLVAGWLSNAENRAGLIATGTAMRTWVEDQPSFRVEGIEVLSRSPEVAQGVEGFLNVSLPDSSLRLDYEALRQRAEQLDAVQSASVQVRAGVLQVRIVERMPAMVWRHAGGLDLVDADGHRVARLANRAARPDLPLIAGTGAPEAIAEARLLWAAADPLRPRLRGLVRVGERRWDVVLDRGQRILLPAEGALGALERAMALHEAQDLLSRDVREVDMRLPARPTLRLSEGAMQELYRIRQQASGAPNG